MIRAECRVMCPLELITTTVGFIFDLKCRSPAPHKKKKTPNLNHFFTEPNKFTYFLLCCNISEHEKRRLSSMRTGGTNTSASEKNVTLVEIHFIFRFVMSENQFFYYAASPPFPSSTFGLTGSSAELRADAKSKFV